MGQSVEWLYQSGLEQLAWEQVRLWLDAAHTSLCRGLSPVALADVWEAICHKLTTEEVFRPLDLDERLMVLGALLSAQYPEDEQGAEETRRVNVAAMASRWGR